MIAMTSCLNSKQKKVEYNKAIIDLVQANIVDTINKTTNCSYQFISKSIPMYIINDTLYKTPIKSKGEEWYEANWNIKNDSIFIFGRNLISDGSRGFHATISNKRSTVNGYLRTHVLMGNLGESKNGPKYHAMPISTKNHNLILNKFPSSIDSIIYGYLEFETEEFYVFENSVPTEFEIESKLEYREKIYFIASKCDDR